MKRKRQPNLFEPVPQICAGREDGDTYAMVAELRRLGYTVYRCGADHLVNGRLLSSAQLRIFHAGVTRHDKD